MSQEQDTLLQPPPQPVTTDSLAETATKEPPAAIPPPPRLLYIGQGEVGHACPEQADVMVSDRATTCHILIARSTSRSSSCSSCSSTNDDHLALNGPSPLVSCAHLDGTGYNVSLQNLFDRHYQHHYSSNASSSTTSNPPGKTQRQATPPAIQIQMDLHILGGYLDEGRSSQEISNWLLYQLNELATKYYPVLRCTLQTCVISSLNTTTTTIYASSSSSSPKTTAFRQTQEKYSSQRQERERKVLAPWGRGLACELATGHVFLAWCHVSAMGPDAILRQARLWCNKRNGHDQRLVTVHTPDEGGNEFQIAPFDIVAGSQQLPIPDMLALPDEQLLTMTSTSPECEEEDFCDLIRQTLSLIWNYRTVPNITTTTTSKTAPTTTNRTRDHAPAPPFVHNTVPRRYKRNKEVHIDAAVATAKSGITLCTNDWTLLPPNQCIS
ncbi:hypothetical protein ACA910_012189 [Epithemia clementina (nom. ined.)]